MDELNFDIDLSPKLQISSLKEELQAISNANKNSLVLHPIDQDEWRSLKPIISSSDFSVDSFIVFNPQYSWKCYEGKVAVFIFDSDLNQITLTDTSISSPWISGEFFSPPMNPELVQVGCNVQLTFDVEGDFPILIFSGDVDGHSAFILAMESIQIMRKDFYEKWATLGALKGDRNCLHFFGRNCLQNQSFSKAKYLLSEAALRGDVKCSIILSLLISEENLKLTENLLCQTSKAGDPEALFHLGKIYLTNKAIEDIDKGKKILTICSKFYRFQPAIEFLQNYKEPWSLADMLITAGIVTSAVGCLYFLSRYVMFKRK